MGDLSGSERDMLKEAWTEFLKPPLEDSPWETGKRRGLEVDVNVRLPWGLSIAQIADELGRNRSAVRKRAHKMGIYLDTMWLPSSRGDRQQTLVTDEVGRAALIAWYGGNNG